MLDLDLDLKTEDLDLLLYTGLGLEDRGLELGFAGLVTSLINQWYVNLILISLPSNSSHFTYARSCSSPSLSVTPYFSLKAQNLPFSQVFLTTDCWYLTCLHGITTAWT